MFLNQLVELVKTNCISQQSAFLAQLIEAGQNTKEKLAECIGKTIRTVERQLSVLYQAGVIHEKNGLLIVATNLSIDQINISITNIDSIDENVAEEISKQFKCHPQRIRQAICNAKVDDPDLIRRAARITLERKPKSLVAYFCRVLQNMKHDEVSNVWKDICSYVKDKVAKCSYEFFFKKAKCVKRQDKLYITGQNVREMWQVYGDLLKPLGVHGYLAGDMLQIAV